MRSRRALLMLSLGSILGAAASLFGPACLILDKCPVVTTPGVDRCVLLMDAQQWPPGQPELAEPIVGIKSTCACMNDAETQILVDGLPAGHYEELVVEIQQAARYACATTAPPGYDHNCFTDAAEPMAPIFSNHFLGDSNDSCIGSCGYAGKNCGPDPNPWTCNEEYGAGETGTSDSGGTGTSGQGPDDADDAGDREVSL